MHSNRTSAFSLVELSIVLVILGLLVGGILAGQSLIRASELRSVSAEYQRHATAVHAFRDKYFALPGDMTNATAFWGAAASGAACKTADSGGTATCDGDGDGMLYLSTRTIEYFRFWQQLANAGLVEGKFTGIANQVSGDSYQDDNAKPGYNCPGSKANSSACWLAVSKDIGFDALSYMFSLNYGTNTLLLGGTTGSQLPQTRIFTPTDAWNIDTKLDDGRPANGRLVANRTFGCTTGSADRFDIANASYNVSYTSSDACWLLFPNPF